MESTASPPPATEWYVPVTEAETVALIESGVTLPLAWGVNGAAIHVTGDGTARPALAALCELRGVIRTGGAV